MADRPDLARNGGSAGHAGRLGASLAGTKVRRALWRVSGRERCGRRGLDGTVRWPLDGSRRAAGIARWMRPAAGGWRA